MYWVEQSGAIVSVPICGGTVTTLAKGQTGTSVAVDATNVYWSNLADGTIMKLPKHAAQ
jgi:hypothetical protein